MQHCIKLPNRLDVWINKYLGNSYTLQYYIPCGQDRQQKYCGILRILTLVSFSWVNKIHRSPVYITAVFLLDTIGTHLLPYMYMPIQNLPANVCIDLLRPTSLKKKMKCIFLLLKPSLCFSFSQVFILENMHLLKVTM